MITHIKGRLSEKSPTNVVIETNGKAKIKSVSNEVSIENAIKNSLFY